MIGEKFNMPRVEAGKSAEFLPEPTICFINVVHESEMEFCSYKSSGSGTYLMSTSLDF